MRCKWSRKVRINSCHFLSRPRRFGKSLFLDTIKELFEGGRELFEGLYAFEHWDWSVRHTVMHLSFGGGNCKEPGYLDKDVEDQLGLIECETGVEPRHVTAR